MRQANFQLGIREVIGSFPVRSAILFTLVIASIFPALGLVIVLAQAVRQLQSAPELLPWKDIFGNHIARLLEPFVENTSIQSGISADFQIAYLPLSLAITGLLHALIKAATEYLVEEMSEQVTQETRARIMQSFFSRSYLEALKVDASLLASMVGPDAKEIKHGVRRMLGLIPLNALQSLVFLLWLVLLDSELFVLFVMVLFPAGVAIRVLSKTLKRLARQGLQSQTEVLGLFVERLAGWETIRVFKTLPYELQKFRKKNLELYKSLRRSARAASLGAPTVEWLGTVAGALVLIIALRRLSVGELSDSVLTGFVVTIAQLSGTLQSLTRHFNSIKKATASVERINRFFKDGPPFQPALLIHPKKGYSFDEPPTKQETKISSVRCQNLAVARSGSHEILFRGLDFDLRPGDFCAITGPSGCGKSTLLRCLLGLESPAEGQVLLSDQAPSELDWYHLSNDVAFIAQDPVIVSGSLFENICFPRHFAHKEADVNPLREQARTCLVNAGLDKDLDASVMELSGGEKQRLMLARAFFKNATLWILDEATSALDSQTEEGFLKVLKKNASEHIVVFVTHRKSVTAYANQHARLDVLRETKSPSTF